jgi:hypothetical protein
MLARTAEDLVAVSRGAIRTATTVEFAAPVEIGDDPADFRRALTRYWALSTSVPAAVRRLRLHALCSAARGSHRRERRALALFALADTDAQVVFDAACAYLHAAEEGGHGREHRVADVCEWVTRRLALRPEAVFAALLVERDPAIDARLLAQRSTTTSARLRELLAAFGVSVDGSIDAFLREWRALELT